MPLREQMGLVRGFNPLPDAFKVHRLLFGTVRNADAAADVDELERDVAVSMMYCGSSSLEATIVWRPKRFTPFSFMRR